LSELSSSDSGAEECGKREVLVDKEYARRDLQWQEFVEISLQFARATTRPVYGDYETVSMAGYSRCSVVVVIAEIRAIF